MGRLVATDVGSTLSRIRNFGTSRVVAILLLAFAIVLYLTSHAPLEVGPLLLPVFFFAVPVGLVSLIAGLLIWWWGGKVRWRGDPESARIVLVLTSPLIAVSLSFPLIGVLDVWEQRDAREYIDACAMLLIDYHAEHGVYPQSLDLLGGRPDAPALVRDGGVVYTASDEHFAIDLAGRYGWATRRVYDSEVGSHQSSREMRDGYGE